MLATGGRDRFRVTGVGVARDADARVIGEYPLQPASGETAASWFERIVNAARG